MSFVLTECWVATGWTALLSPPYILAEISCTASRVLIFTLSVTGAADFDFPGGADGSPPLVVVGDAATSDAVGTGSDGLSMDCPFPLSFFCVSRPKRSTARRVPRAAAPWARSLTSSSRCPPSAASRSCPRSFSVPSKSPRRRSSFGADGRFSFVPLDTVVFSLIFCMRYHLCFSFLSNHGILYLKE